MHTSPLESTIAGSWYPGSADGIRAMSERWERASAADAPRVAPNVLVLPHAGWAYSGETAWRAVRLVKGAKFRRVVLLAPSHRAWIENRLVAPEASAVSTPLGEIRIDNDFIDRMALVAPVAKNSKVHLAEHATQIEYPLLQLALGGGFLVVPLIAGSLGGDQMAMCARALSRMMDAETLLVVSSDFTHYGDDFSYTPFGKGGGEDVRRKVAASDDEAFQLVAKGDADSFAAFIKRTGATICGHVPIELALRAFPKGASVVRQKYATSGDGDGDYSRFVCYVAATGCVKWQGEGNAVLSADDRAYLLRVARASMEKAVRNGMRRGAGIDVSDAPKSTRAKMGAFVTLNDKATGALRGCIGEIMPMRPLVEAVAARAVDSALGDPRFSPVSERELANLRVERRSLRPDAAHACRVLARHRARTRRNDA